MCKRARAQEFIRQSEGQPVFLCRRCIGYYMACGLNEHVRYAIRHMRPEDCFNATYDNLLKWCEANGMKD